MQLKRLVAITCALVAAALMEGASAQVCNGILHANGVACCPSSCGACGGNGCHLFPGGEQNCCSSQISKSNRSCGNSPAPCMMNLKDNTTSTGNTDNNVNNTGAMAAGGAGTGGAANAQTSSNINVMATPGSGPVFVYAPVNGGTAVGGAGTGGGAAANQQQPTQPARQGGYMRGYNRPFFLP